MNRGLVNVAVFVLALYLVVCCEALLEWDNHQNLLAHSYSVWGDWSMHFTFIQNLRERGFGWLWGDNPIFAGVPFQYPFLSHLITAGIAQLLGVSTIHMTEWLSLLLLFLAPFFAFKVFQQFGLKPFASFLSTATFFLAGGYQWMGFLSPSPLSPKEPYTNHFDNASVFTQFVSFEFYPQRAFLFGFVLFVGVGSWLLRRWQNHSLGLGAAIVGGVGLSLLALTHVHSYIALASFLIFFFIFNRAPKVFFFSLGIAALGCTALGLLLLHDRQPEFALSWTYWAPGWALHPNAGLKSTLDMNPIGFWILNTGLFLPMALFGFWLTLKQAERYPLARVWGGAGFFLFILANLFNLQPYWYDNLKVFTYSFFFLAPLVGVFYQQLLTRSRSWAALAIVLFGAQVFSGAADLNFLRTKNQSAVFYTASEFSIAEDFKTLRHSPESLVLIAPRHNHWVTGLAGSPVVMGYPGWLWSWGIQYAAREQAIHQILLGQSNGLELMQKLNIDYVVLNVNDRVGSQPVNLAYFRSQFSRILNREGWEIFSVKSPEISVRSN